MTLVIDASVAAKWLFAEQGSQSARGLPGSHVLIAPDFILLEAHHVMWKRWRRRETEFAAAAGAMAAITAILDACEPSYPLMEAARRISLAHDHAIYDCLYIALAERDDAELVTADDKQFLVARKSRVKVRML